MAVRFSSTGQEYTKTLTWGAITQYSVTCWVKISTDTNDIAGIWSLDDGNSSGFGNTYLRTDTDGTTLQFRDSNAGTVQGARAITVGTWYYVGISVNGANGTMLTRAAGDTSFTVSTWTNGSSSVTATNLRIGKPVYDNRQLNGCIAALKIWGATLSQSELEAEAFQYMPARATSAPDELRAWYPFVRAETTDYGGGGRTLSGGTGATTEDGPPIAWRLGRRKARIPVAIPAEATPGPVNAPWTVPAPAVSLGTGTGPAPVGAPWTIPAPSVYTGDPVTPVDPPVVSAAWTMPAPAVEAFKNVTVSPAPIAAAWAVPAPTVIVPVNPGDDLDGHAQLSYNGFKMGGFTRYQWLDLIGAGVDLPPIDNGNVDNPSSHGAMSGRKLAKPRIIEYQLNIRAPAGQIHQAAQDFLDALPLAEADEELPLAIQLGDDIRVIQAAVTNRAAPVEQAWRFGLVKAIVQWTAANPRLYSRELNSATIPDGGTVGVFNTGNTTTHPLIRCPGPANGPELVIERTLADGTEDVRVIGFDLEVPAGQNLIIDPFNGTAAIGDDSKIRALTTDSNVGVPDWVLGRGSSYITYTTETGTAPAATALWRHAWI
ncbi:LamG-like jellyroll fold domain-containing protein [Sphaerisporangium sp. NPDC004334]